MATKASKSRKETLKNYAVRYAKRGRLVFPLRPQDKRPKNTNGCLGATSDREQVRRWWEMWEGCNIGVATGKKAGFFVLDEDPDKGGHLSRKRLEAQYGPLPETLCARTPSGGKHYYWRYPADSSLYPEELDIRNSAGSIAPGLDIRGTGGYVVAPPSSTPDGQYEWASEAAISDPPTWLLRLIYKKSKEAPQYQRLEMGEIIRKGKRNTTLSSYAGKLRREGFEPEEIFGALCIKNRQCEQPLPEDELRQIAESIGRYPTENGRGPSTNGHGGGTPKGFNNTDLGNANRLIYHHGNNLRFCHPWGKWFIWDETRWAADEAARVMQLAKDTVRRIYGEAEAATDSEQRKALAKHAVASESRGRLEAMIGLAESEPGVPVPVEVSAEGNARPLFNADPWLLNVQNGTLDLRTGELRKQRREDLITKIAPVEYDPKAKAPTWERFLERVLPSEELRAFVQRAVGYALTGDTSEQALFFLHGSGANGKTTLINAVMEALGDYAKQAAPDLLLVKQAAHPTELADLFGARFVANVEVEDGRRFAESLVKQLTGGDKIKARFMRMDFFEFPPTHKVFLSANHKPVVRGTDYAIWRRIKLIPFSVTIADSEKDKRLPKKLSAELPGILAWAVRGCLDWQREGLCEPPEVTNATAEYRADMDVLAQFIDECCVVMPNVRVQATRLYEAYKDWTEANNEFTETQKRFGMRLSERDFVRDKSGVIYWLGIGLSHDGPESGPSGEKGPGSKNSEFAGKTQKDSESPGPSGPKSSMNTRKSSHAGVIPELGPDGPDGPESPPGKDRFTLALQALRDDVPREALEHKTRGDQDTDSVIRSVMHYCARDNDDIEEWRESVVRAMAIVFAEEVE